MYFKSVFDNIIQYSTSLILFRPSLDMLWDAIRTLPDDFPFAPTLKNISQALATDTPGNLMLWSYIVSTLVWTF